MANNMNRVASQMIEQAQEKLQLEEARAMEAEADQENYIYRSPSKGVALTVSGTGRPIEIKITGKTNDKDLLDLLQRVWVDTNERQNQRGNEWIAKSQSKAS